MTTQIFKRDSTGKTRVWSQKIDGNRYRTITGILGGALVESGWTTCVGKQGRSDAEQAQFEVEANYRHKLTREYHASLDDIAGGAHFFKPMLAHKYEGKLDFPVYAQPKLDGIRCIATKDGLFSREGKPILGVPHIAKALEPVFDYDPQVVLDGELYNHEFREDFGAISSIVRKQNPTPAHLAKSAELIEYHIYDMPSHPGVFTDRSMSVSRLLSGRDGIPDCLKLVETRTIEDAEDLDATYGLWLQEGWEGQMVRLNKPYEQKRSKTLLKRKEFMDAEFEVVSIDEGNGNWAGLAKRVTCKLPDGRTFGAGIKGNAARAAELLNEDHKVVTVQYFQLSPDGVPRFPVVTKFHGAERTL